jgi:hypothetical protein
MKSTERFIMLAAKSVLENYSADGATASDPRSTFNFGSSCRPTSPKMQELRARYEALQATENKCADSDFKIVRP